MKTLLVTVVLTIALGGCAAMSAERFDNDMATWIGATEVDVYRGFGRPSGEYQMPNGNRVLFYDRSGGTESSATAGGTSFLASRSEVIRDRSCRIEFELDKVHVVSWRTQGNYCRD